MKNRRVDGDVLELFKLTHPATTGGGGGGGTALNPTPSS